VVSRKETKCVKYSIRKFGCEGHVKTLEKIKKLDPRCEKMKLIGYAENGYRMWNYEKRKKVVARDVIFVENKPKTEELLMNHP
jgi:uncharacterized protein YaeQ